MSVNTSVILSLTTEKTPVLFVNWDFNLISRICFYVLYPCIGVTGLLGNVINIAILTRQGFWKCSNILLLSLAVSDCLYLSGVNNIPMQIYTDYLGFWFSETLNSVCFVLFLFCSCAYVFGSFLSVIIPVLITGERLLAIFYPFQAHVILTPRRTVIVLSSLYTVAGILSLYGNILGFKLKSFLIDGVVVGIIDKLAINERSEMLIEEIGNYLTGVIPISLVTVGCIVIRLKIVQITKRRRQLTSSQVTASTKHGITKTTKTLLKICLLYIVCYGSTFIATFFFQSKLLEEDLYIMWIIQRIHDMLLSVNCVGNFLIYFNARHRFRNSIIVRQRKKEPSR